MTAPASILASFAQPAVRLAMGDATGAALGGFEALLAMLTQSPRGAPDQSAMPGQPTAETPAQSDNSDLAGLLGQVSPAAWLTQAMAQLPKPDEVDATGAANTPVTCSLPQAKDVPAAVEASDTIAAALDALLTRQQPEAIDPAILERIRPVKGQTAAQTLQSLLPTAPPTGDATPGQPVDAAAPVKAPAGVQPSAEVQPRVAAEVVAAPALQAAAQAAVATATRPPADTTSAEATAVPAVIMPPAEAKASAPPRRTADGKITSVDKVEPKASAAAVDIAKVAAAEGAADDIAPVELVTFEAEDAAPAARANEPTLPAIMAKLETIAAGAEAFAARVRGAPETVAKLAAGFLDKLEGRSTRFDMQLDPHGLGKVDVSVEIGSDGKLTAQMGFDSAVGLSELRGRVQELRTALEQAGFSLADNALSFDLSGDRQRREAADGQASRSDQAGKAFAKALGALDDDLAAIPTRYQARRGLDLLI